MITRLLAAVFVAVSLFAAPGQAGNVVRLGSLVIEAPFARATPGRNRTGAAYLSIRNTGGDDDRLIALTSDVAARVELHKSAKIDGVMMMRHLPDGLAIGAGTEAKLAPGGMHLMLMGLKAPLKRGGTFEITLRFQHAGEIVITLPILSVAARSAKD